MKRIVVKLNVLVKSSLSMECGLHSSFVTDFMLLNQCGGVFFFDKKSTYSFSIRNSIDEISYIKRIEFDMCHNNIACDRQFFCMHKESEWLTIAIKRCCVDKSIQQYLIAYACWWLNARENYKNTTNQPI